MLDFSSVLLKKPLPSASALENCAWGSADNLEILVWLYSLKFKRPSLSVSTDSKRCFDFALREEEGLVVLHEIRKSDARPAAVSLVSVIFCNCLIHDRNPRRP